MTIKNPNQSEIKVLQDLFNRHGVDSIEKLGEKMNVDIGKNPTYGGDEVKEYFTDFEDDSIIKARIKHKLGLKVDSIELSREDLLDYACKLTGKNLEQIINEAIDHYVPQIIHKESATRGKAGSADDRIKVAHEEIEKELELGLYRTPKDGLIPTSRLARKAGTSISTVQKWLDKNELSDLYAVSSRKVKS